MLTLKMAKAGTVSALAGLVVHFAAHGWVRGEDYLKGRFVETRVAVISGLAKDLGYEPAASSITPKDAESLVRLEARTRKINETLAVALMRVESRKNQFAESRVGAIGLMQVMPFNAGKCGLKSSKELWDDVKNVRCGLDLFRLYLDNQKQDAWRATQEYNGGASCINVCKESIGHAQAILKELGKIENDSSAEHLTEADRRQLDEFVNTRT